VKPHIQKEHRLNGMEELTNWYAPQKGLHNNRTANLYRELSLSDNGDRDATFTQFAGKEGLHFQRSCKCINCDKVFEDAWAAEKDDIVSLRLRLQGDADPDLWHLAKFHPPTTLRYRKLMLLAETVGSRSFLRGLEEALFCTGRSRGEKK
jgi:hypothetical protein